MMKKKVYNQIKKMSVANSYDGTTYSSPEFNVGFGGAISNASSRLDTMRNEGTYYEELTVGGDTDIILICAEGYLISLYRSFQNQRLMQNFVVRETLIGGQRKLRFVHRNLALSLSFEAALKSCGVNITVPDDFSGNMTAINQALEPIFIQVYKQPTA